MAHQCGRTLPHTAEAIGRRFSVWEIGTNNLAPLVGISRRWE